MKALIKNCIFNCTYASPVIIVIIVWFVWSIEYRKTSENHLILNSGCRFWSCFTNLTFLKDSGAHVFDAISNTSFVQISFQYLLTCLFAGIANTWTRPITKVCRLSVTTIGSSRLWRNGWIWQSWKSFNALRERSNWVRYAKAKRSSNTQHPATSWSRHCVM